MHCEQEIQSKMAEVGKNKCVWRILRHKKQQETNARVVLGAHEAQGHVIVWANKQLGNILATRGP